MKHTPLDQLGEFATVFPEQRRASPMSRRERLNRWAELLERKPQRRLTTLTGTEYQSGETRDAMYGIGSAISVAFEDPLLRAEGLTGDTYGDAKRFFQLSDWQLHDIVCHCHFGAETTASAAARRVRSATVDHPVPRFVVRMRHLFGG